MFDKIISFSIKNKLVVALMTLALIIWGIYNVTRLPVDATPDITNNQVQIITLAPNLGAQEVEQYITAPIELAMGNIPQMLERRSLSRSGISVITIVFKDHSDIYWARQQVTERLKDVEADIPRNMGVPMLSPISTGLGEIYQYVIRTKPGYEKKYTPTDLRTIQDWTIRKMLAGTEGLAEINGWGGFVKQYEIAVDNDRLNALNITIPELFSALERNNENTGAAYIEQHNSAYFIRGIGQARTLDDIGKIVVKNTAGTPVLVKDVATVQFGHATRYGAVTRNGEGEVVAGVTLMLKGENFTDVIKRVKERMTLIQKALPEGVIIEPFIDRTELVDRTIHTVGKNLIEGGLIVIFVLVLLLGNLRAGLLVASVIPLSMLFAISLMNIFGVSGNLMSLGAIDFGLLVDGAVIIVEAIVHRITNSQSFKAGMAKLDQSQMDEEVYTAASNIRNSAAFGEIIILIVYLPIFALVGIEGKMFRPMAQTVSFAILGAFILSLTYVPMMSTLVLSKRIKHRENISDRIITFFHRLYEPLLNFTLKAKQTVVLASFLLLLFSLWIFSGLGGEFIPTLEEGDFALEMRMMQGTSLTQTIEAFSKAEKLLKDKFPEVKQAVTRIGSAEIPTDPMPIEGGDMMLTMKPKKEWTSADTREEMMEKIETALQVIPGLSVEISQPMQMRFNELISGIRQDVAIKIFGQDLDILANRADQVAKLISTVKGVTEPYIERVNGLPQVMVTYNRDKMAQYGLAISDVNMILRTAFAGNVAGVVFEGEKRFDMVVRLQKDARESTAGIGNLYIPLPSGSKVPLAEVATVEIKDAPAQVSREDGNRRIFVGFNVRGRDVESVVKDIQILLEKQISLPAGYYITYGGQFQNLKEAKGRLSVAVPIALLLILVLLYFTFHSLSQTLLIFTAVPLSAIGGILALWIRGMHFSISAGVGFIALFGVAVLNGIVLIGYFNQLEQEGVSDIYERVRKGTFVRLRPVIMTASVASLGFLPMALSTSAGAEVQKPLATVVIGGLISATLLTLLILPALYVLFFNRHKSGNHKSNSGMKTILLILILSAGSVGITTAQQPSALSVDDCIRIARNNSPGLKSAALTVDQSRSLQKTAFALDKTALSVNRDASLATPSEALWGVSQNFLFPTIYGAQSKVLKQQTNISRQLQAVTGNTLSRDVKTAYYNLLFGRQQLALYQYQDSVYKDFNDRAQVRYKTGETSNLERLAAHNKYREIQVLLKQSQADIEIFQLELQKLLNTADPVLPTDHELPKLSLDFTADTTVIRQNPIMGFYEQRTALAKAERQLEKSRLLPDLNVGVNTIFNKAGNPGALYPGFQVGVGIPLFFNAQSARIKAAGLQQQIAEADLQGITVQLKTEFMQQYKQYLKMLQSLQYYESGGLQQADELQKVSQFAFSKGEIGYVEYIQNATQAINTRLQYLSALRDYDLAVIQLNYIRGQQ